MSSAIIRVTCGHRDCAASAAMPFATLTPRGWTEDIGDFTDGGQWKPSVFWCPAHGRRP